MNLIDAAGLTSAPIHLEPYCRALGISGAVIEPDDRLAWLRAMHQAEESHVIYTGPEGADYWLLASPKVLVRIVPGEGEMTKRIEDPALYWLMRGGLSRAKAKAILARKTPNEAQSRARDFAELLGLSPPPSITSRHVGDAPPPGGTREEPFQWEVVDNPAALVRVAQHLEAANREGQIVGLDTEATSEDDRVAELIGVGSSFGRECFYLPVLGEMGDVLRALLERHLPGLKYIAHNAKYDRNVLLRAGLPIDKAVLAGDGMIAAYVLADVDERGLPRPKGLKPLALRWLSVQLQTYSEMMAAAQVTDLRDADPKVVAPYCTADAFYAVEVERCLREAIVAKGIRLDLYEKLELPNVVFLSDMELRGLPIDLKATKERKKEYEGKVTQARFLLTALARKAGYSKTKQVACKMHGRKKADIAACEFCDDKGHAEYLVTFNPGSGPQLDALFRGIWRLPVMGFTEKGAPQYNEAALLRIREYVRAQRRGEAILLKTRPSAMHPAEEFITELLAWRKDSKVLNTYLVNFSEKAREEEHAPDKSVAPPVLHTIHTRFNQTVVESGRLSSEDPNAQNIPLHLRDLFVAPPGWYIWCADHGQLELRILARVSQCRAMMEAFAQGQDIHALTAQRVFGIAPANLAPEMRVRSKVLNFGVAYEGSPDAVLKLITKTALLMPELGLTIPSLKDCALLVREFFRAYPEVEQAIAFHHDKTSRLGYSSTLYGRRRYLPNITHPSQELRARAERQAWNLVIQGTAGDIMKAGQLVVESYAGEHQADVRCQVHDELWGLCKQETLEEWLRVVAKAVVLDQPLRPVLLEVEPKAGRNWKEAK